MDIVDIFNIRKYIKFLQKNGRLTVNTPELSGDHQQTFQDASGTIALLSDIVVGGIGSGTVTSVTINGNADIFVDGSPITTSGEIDLSILSAPKWTNPAILAGNSIDGGSDVAFTNKFIVRGTSDSGLSNAQFLGALASGIVKNTTSTGVLSIAALGVDYEVPLTFSTGLTRTANTIIINAVQNITRLSNLSTNGFVKTNSSDGTLSIDTTTYIPSVFGRTGAITAQSGDYTTSLITEGSNLYFTNVRSIASTLTGYSSGSGTVSSSDSILQAIQKLDGNTALLTGAIIFQGSWNASANSPSLVSGTGTKGYLYKVGTAGTTTIDGISQWNAGDSIVFNGTVWDKIDGIATEVLSVNGLVGAVALTGTSDRITIGGSNIFDIATTYVGQSSITTLGTIGIGTWAATKVGEIYGGTNQSTYSQGDILYASASNTLSKLTIGATSKFLTVAAGVPSWSTSTIPSNAGSTANKLLLSDGTDYVLSTPTFPNASATTRKIIISDGTNWTASTETYAVPGLSGNFLKSDGTNWIATTIAASDYRITTATPMSNGYLKGASSLGTFVTSIPIADLPTNVQTKVINYVIDGLGGTLNTGNVKYITIPYSGTISKWSVNMDGSSPTCTVDIWKIGTGTTLPTVSNTIFAGSGLVKPNLASGNSLNNQSINVGSTGTASVTAYDIIAFHVDAVTIGTLLNLSLELTLS